MSEITSNHEPKTARIDARLPESVHVLLQRAASLQGRTVSDFVVTSAREAAEEAIARFEMLTLNAADQKRFAEALLNPAPPNEAMQRAAERHRNLIESS